jgi:hypothetical protein
MKMGKWDKRLALLSAYRNSILRYQRLLKTELTEIERGYIKGRLSACEAAVNALAEPTSRGFENSGTH